MARTAKNKRKKQSPSSSTSNRKKGVARKTSAGKNRRVAKRTTIAAAAKKNRSRSTSTKRKRTASRNKKTKSGSPATVKRSQKPTSNTTEHTIVRIMGQGQYKIDKATMEKLNEIDNEIVKIFDGKTLPSESSNVSEDTNSRLQSKLSEMASLIINKGEPLSTKEIVPSDFIIPPVDTSLEEAQELFKEEGILPG